MSADNGFSAEENVCLSYVGISCAFAALGLVPRARKFGEFESETEETLLKGTAYLLGIIVHGVQRAKELKEKLKRAEFEVEEMKMRRTEDAKANEKVVGIFAAHEQSWIAQRKSLLKQIQSLVKEMQILKANNEEGKLNYLRRIRELEQEIAGRDEAFNEELTKRKELEEKLRVAKEFADELRERAKKEAQDHSAELWKHKTAFVELVSNQRQMEAEMNRAVRQVEAAKQELEEAFERKDEAVAVVEKLSTEILMLRKDSEQKDKILSAILRKTKVDAAEKQMLLKEVKISKAKKKQAELEIDRWKSVLELRQKRSSRGFELSEAGSSHNQRNEWQLESSEIHRKNFSAAEDRSEDNFKTVECVDETLTEGNNKNPVFIELAMNDIEKLQDWVQIETEKYTNVVEQRHFTELEAFIEQLRQRDEKLEAFRWQILSMELETKRLQSHMDGLDGNLSYFREENLRLESILMDKEKELKSLKQQLNSRAGQFNKSNSGNSPRSKECKSQSFFSEIKISKRKPRDKEDSRANKAGDTQETDSQQLELHKESEIHAIEIESTSTTISREEQLDDESTKLKSSEKCKRTENSTEDKAAQTSAFSSPVTEEIEEEKLVKMDQCNSSIQTRKFEGTDLSDKLSSAGLSLVTKNSSWKMDIHALGVSYKIKRLKQQLLVLERLAGSEITKHLNSVEDTSATEESVDKKSDENWHIKGFLVVKALLNKQLKRYQSLEEKTDDLCKKMHEINRSGSRREQQSGRTKEKTETLECFLQETFQLQRYMVATGQKLMEIQSRIATGFSGVLGLNDSVGFNIEQFADIVRSLFKEIQRGLEVRIARIIGDLEGTLASEEILYR